MFEIIFLFCLGLVWIVFATFEDLRTSEIANWLNFSLIIFALGFRFFYSLFSVEGFGFFYQGLIGVGIFFILSNLFYYGKMYAGGDSRLMMALGAILPFYSNFQDNLQVFLLFLILFLVVGGIYGLVFSAYLGIKNFSKLKKEFSVQLKKQKKIVIALLFLACVFLVLGFFQKVFFYWGLVWFILPYFYIYVKSVDECCMVKKVLISKLTVGDWLYKDEKVGNKTIKATWDGLSEKDIKLLKKKKFVLVRYGIRFAPVFLISFVLVGIIIKFGLIKFIFGLFGF